MSIVKSANPLTYSAVGQQIRYDYLVRNTGNIPLTNIMVVDNKAGTAVCPRNSLAVDDFMYCYVYYTITATDMTHTSVTNVVELTSAEIPTPLTDTAIVRRMDSSVVGAVAGVLFYDKNTDGEYQPGESLINSPVIVELVDANNNVVSTTTMVNGAYNFALVPPGEYTVRLASTPAGYISTSPLIVPVTVVANETSHANFGMVKVPSGTFSLSGVVWNDVNKNTIYESGENPIPGITITLYNSSGKVVGTTTTNAQGKFFFSNIAAGVYSIHETDGKQFAMSSTVNTKWVIVGAGDSNPLQFGDYNPDGSCTKFSDPIVDTRAGSFPTNVNTGDPFYMQFQVSNNGNQKAGLVEAYTQIPSYLKALSVNITAKAVPGVTDPVDGYTQSLSGNSLMIHFTSLTPGYTYNVEISTIVKPGAPAGTHTFNVNIHSNTPSCGDVPANDSGIFTLHINGANPAATPTSQPQEPETGLHPGPSQTCLCSP
jgi:hypothetical protein